MINLNQYFNNKKLSYKETSTNQLILECPVCHKHKLYINNQLGNKYGQFLCFSSQCNNIKGNLVGLISLFDGITYSEAHKRVFLNQKPLHSQLDKLHKNELKFIYEIPNNIELSEIVMPNTFEPITSNLDYLIRRGVTEEMIKEYDIRYARNMDRVIFPIKVNGVLVGWQGRDILGEEQRTIKFSEEVINRGYKKILNSTGLKKAYTLLNYDNVKHVSQIVIVEGPFDSLKTRNSVALLGKNMSRQQLSLLLDTDATSVVIAIDPEENEDRKEMVSQLAPFFTVYELVLPAGTDPGDHTRHEMDQFIANATVQDLTNSYMSLIKRTLVL